MRKGTLIVFVLATLGICQMLLADDGATRDTWTKAKVHEDSEQVPDVDDNESALDTRLPPVLPGESVTRGGRKMKVWSTSGSVSTGKAPKPFNDPGEDVLDDVDVIVDHRSDNKPRHVSDSESDKRPKHYPREVPPSKN